MRDRVLHKKYFQAYDGPKTWGKRFLRSAFFREDRPNAVLLVYEGDSSAAVDFPHGNAKLARAVSRPYIRTQPHVLKEIEMQASTSSGPRDVYRSLVAERPTGERQELVRDTEQVRYSVILA